MSRSVQRIFVNSVLFYLAFGCFLHPRLSQAIEIYSLIDKSCHAKSGHIINVDDQTIHLLTLEGRYDKLPAHELNHVLIYNLISNPVSQIDLSGGAADFLRSVSINGDQKANFTGWPIRFIENWVVFYDLEGKTFFMDIQKIVKISTPEIIPQSPVTVSNYESVHLGVGQNLPECAAQHPEHDAETRPTRMISDQIKISQFLSRFQKGFEELERFQQRTRFYARPFLYDTATQLGLVYLQDLKNQELRVGPPFYFQWSNGRPYSHQSLFVLGSKPLEWLPNAEAVFAVRTEVKSHFFNGFFAGNPIAMQIGKGFMIDNRLFFQEFLKQSSEKKIAILPQFNYMAMTGIDWGAWSFSGGGFYPVIGIHGNDIFREVLATQAAPVFRLQHTRETLKFRGIMSLITNDVKSPGRENIQLIHSHEFQDFNLISPESIALSQSLEKFSLDAQFVRAGFDWEVNEEIHWGMDQIGLTGTYHDEFPEARNSITFSNLTTSAYLQHRFGNYVTLTGYLNYFLRHYSYQFNQKKGTFDEAPYSLMAAVSFFL
ncbi:MAG: hypothetical protein HQM12_01910 [SAR324 cluster bacterium]|nr:hypothetical protein [SAR324 cluster bacterium]